MSRSKLYVTDGLLYRGAAYDRGDEIVGLDSATEEALLESGQISTTKPSPVVTVTDQNGAVVTVEADITSFTDEELLAEVEARGLVAGGKVEYSELDKDDLEKLVAEREIEVTGTGKDGNVVKADLVKALEDADTAASAS